MSLLALDSRWRRFNDEARACPCCGRSFNGVFDIGYDHPDAWPHAPAKDGTVAVGEDALTTDMCRLDGRFFLRCVLMLPVRGAEDAFGFGPWAEVSRDTATAYAATYGDDPTPFAGAEGLLANALHGFEDEAEAPVRLQACAPDARPSLQALDGPLAETQADGISFDRLLDICAAAGMDLRPHLRAD